MEKIPSNICSSLIRFLDLNDIFNCMILNKHWRNIMNKNNQNFWKLALHNIENLDTKLIEIFKVIKKTENNFELFKILKPKMHIK
jgi:hypothetical protein